MSQRTGKRRAAVLLALGGKPRSVNGIGRELGLKFTAVDSILDALIRDNLATPHPDGGVCVGAGPHVAQAQAEARALLENATSDQQRGNVQATQTNPQVRNSASPRVATAPARVIASGGD